MGSAELCVVDSGEHMCSLPLHGAGNRPGVRADMHGHQGGRRDTQAASRPGALIKGVTSACRVFRPSDWAQRMAAAATVNCGYCGGRGEGRYNPHVRVLYVDGVTCLWLADELLAIDAPLHAFVMRFAHDNHLKVVDA